VWSAGSGPQRRASVQALLDAMAHRGPDGRGLAEFAGGAVGMVRLALVGLSEHGQRPLRSADGRVAIVFNGKIYNLREERAMIERRGYRFRSTADTEVILALSLEDPLAMSSG
jgi:asparagine synthase (glutamine-hydrolysing)